MARLSNKQQAFISCYLTTWNASEAARLAGYSERSARFIGRENLTKPYIQAAIKARLDDLSVSSDEVIVRLTDIARGSLEDFIDIDDTGGIRLDLAKAARLGKLHLIKRLEPTEWGWRIELYDAQAALVQLGKALGVFKEETHRDEIGIALAAILIRLADERSQPEGVAYCKTEQKQ